MSPQFTTSRLLFTRCVAIKCAIKRIPEDSARASGKQDAVIHIQRNNAKKTEAKQISTTTCEVNIYYIEKSATDVLVVM